MPSEHDKAVLKARAIDAKQIETASLGSHTVKMRIPLSPYPDEGIETRFEGSSQTFEELERLRVANERLQDEADSSKYHTRNLENENRRLRQELEKMKQQQDPQDSFTTFLRRNHEFHQTVPVVFHVEETRKLAQINKKQEEEIKKLNDALKAAQEEVKLSEAVQKEFHELNVKWALVVSQSKEANTGLEKKVVNVEFQNRKLHRTIEQLEAKLKKLATEEPRFTTSSSQSTTRSSSLFTSPRSSGNVSPQNSDIIITPRK